jgi:hypothetical protein
MRIRLIEAVSFRYSEDTNLRAVLKKHPLKLSKNDVVVLVSKTGNQIVFCIGIEAIGIGPKRVRIEVTDTRRLRLSRGTWNPTMLVNYAESAGLAIEGLKRFEDYYAEAEAA